jgi:hypothetical protein
VALALLISCERLKATRLSCLQLFHIGSRAFRKMRVSCKMVNFGRDWLQ